MKCVGFIVRKVDTFETGPCVCVCVCSDCASIQDQSLIFTMPVNSSIIYDTAISLLVATLVTGDFTSSANSSDRLNCTLIASESYHEQMPTLLSNGVKLIEMRIEISDYPSEFLKMKLKGIYRPYHWVRSTGQEGKSLLMLEENYDLMSLTTLSIGVDSVSFNISENPQKCLQDLAPGDVMMLLRKSFLAGFSSVENDGHETHASSSFGPNENLCNMHVVNNNGHASFRYECCHNKNNGDIECKGMEKTRWISILLALILILKITILLYSPMFLPESLYRLKYMACQYVHHLSEGTMPLKIVVTQHPHMYGKDYIDKTVRLSNLPHMDHFKTLISSSLWKIDKIYEVTLKDVHLSVKQRRLLDRTKVPVRLTTLLYNNLFRCRIKKLEALKPCCDTSILGRFSPKSMNVMKWNKCLRYLAELCLLVLLATPWIIRLMIYYLYEYDMLMERKYAAESVGLPLNFRGSIVLYLNPLHAVFLIIYFIIIIDSLVYGALSNTLKKKLNFVMTQCLRDMREISRVAVCCWAARMSIIPFKLFGLFGFIFLPVYFFIVLGITLPVLAFYIIPTLNLSVRLIIHLFIFMCPNRMTSFFSRCSERLIGIRKRLHIHEVTAKESFIQKTSHSTRSILLHLISIIMGFVSFWSVTLLLVEILSFFVEILVYTFMGIIVNAGVILQYCTVLFLLLMYTKNTFSQVYTKYLEYHEVIHNLILAMKKEEIDAVAKLDVSEQQNTAFKVVGDMTSIEPRLARPILRIKEHMPQWLSSGMLVFLDRYDTPYTPEKFFYRTINLDYFGCPGKIYRNVLLAIWDLAKVFLFLIFIFIIIMAFSDAYHVSTTNQLLATAVGGIVPFFVRNFFKTKASPGFDTSSLQFITGFHLAINEFEQAWPVYDIIPHSFKEVDITTDTKADILQNDVNTDCVKTVPTNISTDSVETALTNTHNTNECTALNDESGVDNYASTSADGFHLSDESIALAELKDCKYKSSLRTPSKSGTDNFGVDEDKIAIDMIVDISTSNTKRRDAFLRRKNLESGSMSMLDWSRQKKERNTYASHTHQEEDIV